MDDAIGRVRSVERGAGPQDDLYPLDVLLGRRDEVHQIDSERRNARQTVVRQHVERTRKDVVESSHHHVGRL